MKEACRRVAERMAAFADGALESSAAQEVQSHIDRCPPCRVLAACEAGARALLRARASRLKAPVSSDLRSRCAALCCPTVAWHARRSGRMVIGAVGMAAMVALAVFVTGRSDALLAAQLTADHVKCFTFFEPGEGVSLTARDAQQSLLSRYGWDLSVPSPEQQVALQLTEARRCLYAGGRIPHLMYRANGHEVSLFILQGESRAPSELVSFGHRARIWSRGNTTFVLVSDASASNISSALTYVADRAR
jgi:anti-sigma factor RsiW